MSTAAPAAHDQGLTLADANDIVAAHVHSLERAAVDAFAEGPAELYRAAEVAWQRLSGASKRCGDPASDVLARASYRCALIAAATEPQAPRRGDPDVWNGCHMVVREIRDIAERCFGEEAAAEVSHA